MALLGNERARRRTNATDYSLEHLLQGVVDMLLRLADDEPQHRLD